MSLADGVRGVIQNILGEKSDVAVLRDATYIHAERYDWQLSKPLAMETNAEHRRWLECWQCIEIADLHHFPLWEKGVFDCLHDCFSDLLTVFAHYAKSRGGTATVCHGLRPMPCRVAAVVTVPRAASLPPSPPPSTPP